MKTKALRQGDVMLWPAEIPAEAKRIKLRPIALGERTGHHHSLALVDLEEETKIEDAVEMYEHDGKIYVRIIAEGVALTHQQHKSHATPAGSEYVYIPQVENSDWGTRQVID